MAPQVVKFFLGEFQYEVLRETVWISSYGAIERFGFDVIKFRQIFVQHDLVSPNKIDAPFNMFNWN